MRILAALALPLVLVAPTTGRRLLVRVDLAAGRDISAVAGVGAGVLNVFDGWCLVRGDDAVLGRLREQFSCAVLDTAIETERYVYASVGFDFDRQRLATCGKVLTEDREGALLRVTGEDLRRLTTMPVELCGVSTEPAPSSLAPSTRALSRFSVAPSTTPDSLLWQLMARASQDSAEAVLRRLIAFRTRYALSESCWAASDWFRERLLVYGCDSTWLDTFQIPDHGPSVNIIGIKYGQVNPHLIHIICGHIDNTSETPETFAPGSDDNASGAGLVLEAARMFQGVEFDRTVWFIGFGAEEWGLVGSDTFARECYERGDTVVLAINHDMDSYGTAGRDSIRVVGKRANPPCSTWVEYYMAMADTFTNLKCLREVVDDQANSDQHSFWDYGYAAIRDRYLDRTPRYHSTGDTIGPYQYYDCGTNNIPMYTEAIRATVATIARLAGAHHKVGAREWHGPPAVGRDVSVAPSVGSGPLHIHLSSATSDVSVYDATGRAVRHLGTGRSVTWDGRDFSGAAVRPGVYCLRADGSSAKFTLVR